MVQHGQDVLRQWQAEELVEVSIDLSGMIYQKLTYLVPDKCKIVKLPIP